ncbi:unnamed protein product, partial [Musa acuminata subsp. malaccensis]
MNKPCLLLPTDTSCLGWRWIYPSIWVELWAYYSMGRLWLHPKIHLVLGSTSDAVMRRFVSLRWLLPKKIATVLGTRIRLWPITFVHHPFVHLWIVALQFIFLFLFLFCFFHLFFGLFCCHIYLIPFFLGCSATGIEHPSHCSDRVPYHVLFLWMNNGHQTALLLCLGRHN